MKRSWSTLNNDEIFKKNSFACGVYDDRYIIVAGGWNDERATMYDTKTHTHVPLPNLPLETYYHGVVLGEYFYAVRHFPCKIYRLSLSKRTVWEAVGDELQRCAWAVVSDGNNIFLLDQIKALRYDPVTESFTYMPSLPKSRQSFAAAVVRNKIFVMGGFFFKTLQEVDIFDIASQSWSKGPSLPEPLAYAAATTVFDRWIVVTGGWFNYRNYNTRTYVYDTINQQWTINDVGLSPSRILHSCASIGSQIISVKGRDKNSNYCPIQAIRINHIVSDFSWEMIKDFILLRQLVDKDRAFPSNENKEAKTNIIADSHKTISGLMMDIPPDLFRNILLFLI